MNENKHTVDIKSYYSTITSVDILSIARELIPSRITDHDESRNLLTCDCPHHASSSHRSLHVSGTRQAFYCFGCGVGGDVLQFVEWIHTGKITKSSGKMSESHRAARDYLASKVNLPSLSSYGITPDAIAKLEADRQNEIDVRNALTRIAKHYHDKLLSKQNENILSWFYSNYAITETTIHDLLIGYSDNSTIINDLSSGNNPSPTKLITLAQTGAFKPTNNDTLNPFFVNRITFPYWSSGNVVYMIGRKTLSTPDHPWESGKYRKLPTRDEHGRSHISPIINNDHLYNEDVLLTPISYVIITEGVTDCIVLQQAGFPVISPVTVRLKHDDWKRIIPKLRGIKNIYICQDNEVSGVGLQGALDTAGVLSENGITTRIIVLPRQSGTSKVDPNSWFLDGGDSDKFRSLIDNAKTPIEIGISSLNQDTSINDLNVILSDISIKQPMERVALIEQVAKATGNKISTIKEQVSYLSKNIKNEPPHNENRRNWDRNSNSTDDIPDNPDSCKSAIAPYINPPPRTVPPDYQRAAWIAYDWLVAHGAKFFYTPTGNPFCFYDNNIYYIDSSDRGVKRQWAALILKLTGISPATSSGKIFFEEFASLSLIKGIRKQTDSFSWMYTDVANHTIYFNLNNEKHELVKITPDSINVIQNAGNTDGIILESSSKFAPMTYDQTADIQTADNLISELITSNLACSVSDREFIVNWFSVFLLMDFTGTKAITRFEGSSGSGKTTASKLISNLVYGSSQHKKSTDAANYSDGAVSPIVMLDNIESKDVKEDLTNFMITASTGISKEKRKAGSDRGTIREKPKCLINTTGIEPLSGNLSEVQSRMFVIQFDLDLASLDINRQSDNQADSCFLESDVLAHIKSNRDYILSAMIKRTSRVLSLIRDGSQKRVMQLLSSIPDNDKKRCNDYLSLMYLWTVAGIPISDNDKIESCLSSVKSSFLSSISSINETSRNISAESNPIVSALSALFNSYDRAVDLDITAREKCQAEDNANHVVRFIERYNVEFESQGSMKSVSATVLLAACKRVSKDFGIEFEYRSPEQLARRIIDSLETIRRAGFNIDRSWNSHSKTYSYSIRRNTTSDIDSFISELFKEA